MNRYVLTFAVCGGLALVRAQPSLAQDSVQTKTAAKPIAGTIEEESPRGIKIKGTGLIPAADIVDVVYSVPVSLKFDFYNPALKIEKELETAKTRKTALSKTIEAYTAFLPKLTEKNESLRRHIEYKIANYTAQLAIESGTRLAPAIELLKKFCAANPKGWQIVRASTLLAQLLIDDKKFDDAEAVYADLADKDYLSDDDRDSFRLAAARVSIRAENYQAALTKLQAVADKLKDPKQKTRAEVYQAECLAQLNKADEARAKLKVLLADPKLDKDLRATAYNALGYCYYVQKRYKDALWEFLRVDVIYHQDRQEHARALYYLTDLFEKLKDTEHAAECREKLKSKQFAGTDYQARLK
jgi:tetratricopeptide (TPR) repeat protein